MALAFPSRSLAISRSSEGLSVSLACFGSRLHVLQQLVFYWFRPVPLIFISSSFRTLQLSPHKNLLDNQFFPPCWTIKTFQSTQSVKTSTENHGNFWNWKSFVLFGVKLRHFHFENCNELFGKAHWTTCFFLFDPFQCSDLQSPSKTWKKCLKSLKIVENLLFSVSIWDIFILKNAIIFSTSLLDNQLFPCWPFKIFQFTDCVKNLTKNL